MIRSREGKGAPESSEGDGASHPAPAYQQVLAPVLSGRQDPEPGGDPAERRGKELPEHPHHHDHGRDQQPVADDLAGRELLTHPAQDLRELEADEDEEDRLEG